MKFRRLWAVARKEFLHVFRDFRSLGMAIFIPLMMMVLFGYALTLDVDNVRLVVWDQSRTTASRDFIQHFIGSRYFLLVGYVTSYPEIDRAIDTSQARMALVVPREFGQKMAPARDVDVQLIVDGSDSNTATIAIGYADGIVQTVAQEITLKAMQRQGQRTVDLPLEVRPRVWFNEDMHSRNFIVPGLIAVIMMVISAILTSLTVAREWERGTMEQLVSTPIKGPELVLGKLVPYFAIGMFDLIVAVLMGEFLFHVPFRGSAGLLFGMASIFLAGVLAMGMLISIVTKSQLISSQLAMTTTLLPAFLLSGFMVPVVNMPPFVQLITYLVPARYFVALLRGVYLKGVGLETMGGEIALLTAFGAAMLVLCVVKFQKKLT